MIRASAAAAGALLLAAGVWLAARAPRDDAGAAAPPSAHAPAPPATAVAPPVGAEPEPSGEPEAASGPELARYRETVAFNAEVRAFFDGYRELDATERNARAAKLLAQIEERERDGRVLPPEALLLRLGILRATVDDPAVLESETRRLIAEHSAAVEQAAASRVPDPRDAAYEKRQAEIAREVMALAEIPGGVSREEYLRERLRELRIEVYANGQPAPQ